MYNQHANEVAESNSNFVKLLFNEGGMQKNASAAPLDQFLQTYVREDGLARKILTPQPITENDFQHNDESRDPYVIRSITPKSMGASSQAWQAGTGTGYLNAGEFRIYIKRIQSLRLQIDKIYLTTYKGSLVEIFKDLTVMDLLQAEDIEMMNMVDTAVGMYGTNVNPNTGIRHYLEVGTTVNHQSIAYALKGLTLSHKGLTTARCLVHRSLWMEIAVNANASDQGDAFVEDILMGNTGKIEQGLFGLQWLTTINRNMVAPEALYMFIEEENLGNFVTYQDAKMHTKVEDDVLLTFHSSSTGGQMIANLDGIVRADFKGTEREDWTEDRVEATEE